MEKRTSKYKLASTISKTQWGNCGNLLLIWFREKFREIDLSSTESNRKSSYFHEIFFQVRVNFAFSHTVGRPPFLERTSRRQLSASKSSPSSHVTKPDCSPKSFGLLQSIDAYFLLSSLFLALATSIKWTSFSGF